MKAYYHKIITIFYIPDDTASSNKKLAIEESDHA